MDYPGAGVAIFVWSNNKVVMLKRTSKAGKDKWCPPCGRMEWHETPEAAAQREVLEETGLTIKNLHFIGYTNDIITDVDWHYVTLFYHADAESDDARLTEPDKFSELQWCKPDKLPQPLIDCATNYVAKFGAPRHESVSQPKEKQQGIDQ